jgi:hypothetical protein
VSVETADLLTRYWALSGCARSRYCFLHLDRQLEGAQAVWEQHLVGSANSHCTYLYYQDEDGDDVNAWYESAKSTCPRFVLLR